EGRRVAFGSVSARMPAPPQEPPSPLVGEGMRVRGARRWPKTPRRADWATSAHPSSDRFAATFSLKGRREDWRRRLSEEPPSPLEGEGLGMRGALSWGKRSRAD